MIRFHPNWVKEQKNDGFLSLVPDRIPTHSVKISAKLVSTKRAGIRFYDPETNELKNFDIAGDHSPTVQFLDSSVLIRVFDPSTRTPTLFEFSLDGEFLNSVESQYVGFSESGKFLAIEREGKLLFYERSSDR